MARECLLIRTSWFFLTLSLLSGCEKESRGKEQKLKERPVSGATKASEPAPAPKQAVPPTAGPAECPKEMVRIPGGEFWVGTEREVFEREENPRFRARVASFCVDPMEVSVEEYEACLAAGKCTPPHGGRSTCNTSERGRGDHPMNCIDHGQAVSVCGARGARLLTEVEWEYLARGGSEMRKFPWGDEAPDGRTCWKEPNSCPRGQYAQEAFGLHDVVGNLWEWTDSWFGPYPWPAADGRHKVYRGGSWSRRFEKWLSPTLRNRMPPSDSGSHLGTRCAMNVPETKCAGTTLESGACSHEILEVKCLETHVWNGVRCASPSDTERCGPASEEVPGYGCVRKKFKGEVSAELKVDEVSRARSPEFDADCQENQPERPKAYRFSGGGHLARNAVGKSLGCKNRDVGVGFNSSCCP